MTAPANIPIEIYQGQTFEDFLEYTEEDGTPVDLTGCSAVAHIRPELESATVLMELSTLNNRIKLNEEPGKIRITTRLDNDDAMHPRLVALVQETARLQMPQQDVLRGFYVSFPIGCCERKGDFYVRREIDNAFQSFVSAPECDRTVMAADKTAPTVLKYARPLWCQVVHDDNVTVALEGVYWPWGGSSEFAPGITNGFRRDVGWQCAEIVRSAAKYFLKR